ncbi:MAG: oligosaccharide flippase family protein, partial [Solirubrobacterales bacterium]|nr:oligosaccharide flippase family protein [Solirubrobacterales bacterium]
ASLPGAAGSAEGTASSASLPGAAGSAEGTASSASFPGAAGSAEGRRFGERVVKTGFAALFWATTVGALIALVFAGPISEALLDRPDAELGRLAVLGLWTLTLWEYVLTLLRLDERARAYLVLTTLNVLATVPVTVWLLVVDDRGAAGILLGTFGTGAAFLLWRLWVERRRLGLRPEIPLLRRMLRFGLPTMPAELSLYSLNFIDRILIVRYAGLAEAGLYALAVKFAQGMNVIARGFQLAFPPLAYSIADDDEARRAYSLIVTWFAAICAFFVAGLWLLARWIVDLLAAPEYFDAYEAVGLLATGVALYALYLVLVVVLGRSGRTEFNLPATVAGTAVNVVLNVILIPPLGIVGAGIALVASYAVVLVAMYVLTQRLFPVAYEWGRLALLVVVTAAIVAGGELLLPTAGIGGLAARVAAWLAIPIVLLACGFLTSAERASLRTTLRPAAVRERLRALAAEPPGAERESDLDAGNAPEVYEAARRDEDRL